jgi:TolA-binding protein
VHRQQWADALKLAEGIRIRFPKFNLQFEADYVIGRCLNSQARFALARQSFRQVINAPLAQRTETAAMAQWMIGETYFHQSNYIDAIRAYYRVEALYDLPRWQAAALLQAAKCHELNDQWKEAHQLYTQLRSDYPESRFAKEATRRLRVSARGGAE